MTSYLPLPNLIFLFFFPSSEKKTEHFFLIFAIFAHISSKNKAWFDYMFVIMIFGSYTIGFLGVMVMETRNKLFDDCLFKFWSVFFFSTPNPEGKKNRKIVSYLPLLRETVAFICYYKGKKKLSPFGYGLNIDSPIRNNDCFLNIRKRVNRTSI